MAKKVNKNKVKPTRNMTHDEVFDLGWASVEAVDNAIWSKVPEKDEEGMDVAFLGAFQGLTYRLAQLFKKEFLLEIVTEISDDVMADFEANNVEEKQQDKGLH